VISPHDLRRPDVQPLTKRFLGARAVERRATERPAADHALDELEAARDDRRPLHRESPLGRLIDRAGPSAYVAALKTLRRALRLPVALVGAMSWNGEGSPLSASS
jgi:hypothetical protein